MFKLTLLFTTLALAVASAASSNYRMTITSPTWVGTTQLNAGDYRIQVDGDKAIIREGGEQVVQVPAKMETNPQEYAYTSLDIAKTDNKPMLREVRVGGTKTRIVLETGSK